MRRPSLPCLVLGVLVAVAAIAPTVAADPGPDTRYVVQPGDTCLGIAIRILGDRARYGDLHRLNPQLGALPHVLVPGSILTLPPRAASGPDARLTRAYGDVKIRKPADGLWDAARRGMDLFRAWRIGAAERSTAELTFGDASRLGMRERTVVVIYGPEKRLAKVITATAELEQGALEARLGDLDGRPVIVRTPSAEADLRAGDVLITTTPDGPSIVANHRGGPVAVRGRTRRPTQVKVGVGMGSRVQPGKAPEPPRPLPATPVWQPPASAWIVLGAPTAAVTFGWSAVPSAATYRIAIIDRRGEVITARQVASPATTTEVALAPGRYRATVAAIDPEGFEGAPTVPLEIEIAEAALVPAGHTRVQAGAHPVIAAGGALIAPAGFTCSTPGSAAAERLALRIAGPAIVTCTGTDGRRAAPLAVNVVAPTLEVAGAHDVVEIARGQRARLVVTVHSEGALGDQLAIELPPGLTATIARRTPTTFQVTIVDSAQAPARARIALTANGVILATRELVIVEPSPPPRAPAARPRGPWQIGPYVGYQHLALGEPADLGAPASASAALEDGLLAGLRAGWAHRWIGFEAEVGFARLDHVQLGGTDTLASYRAHAVLRLEDGPATVGLLAGVGASSVVYPTRGTARDTELVVAWGAMVSLRHRDLIYRADLRHEVLAGATGFAHGLQAILGVAIELGR